MCYFKVVSGRKMAAALLIGMAVQLRVVWFFGQEIGSVCQLHKRNFPSTA